MRHGLGDLPLTLFVIVAGVILFFYLRRANLGIDQHPGEKVTAQAAAPIGPPVPLIGPQQPITIAPFKIPGILPMPGGSAGGTVFQ